MAITTLSWILFLLIFFIGASIFSFVNVLIYRVPRHLPFANERSFCPNCKNQLKFIDMFPVLNYIYLRGKCRYCGQKISVRYPLIECLGGLLALACVMRFGHLEYGSCAGLMQAAVVFLLLAMLTAITFSDIDTMEIPNGFVLAVLVLAIVSIFVFPEVTILQRLIGMVCISIPMILICLVIPGAFGGGDIKLMAAAGVFLGWKLTFLSFCLGVLTGGLYGMYLLAAKKKDRKDHFAFGPFLCVGMALAIFIGDGIIQWYLGFLV